MSRVAFSDSTAFPLGRWACLVVSLCGFCTLTKERNIGAPVEYLDHASGVQIEDNEAEALFRFEKEGLPSLTMEVRGPRAMQLFRILVETVDLLLGGWYNGPFSRVVLCNCSVCHEKPMNKRLW